MTVASAVDPMVKDWCPGAHRPMMSGDGLVVRIRPMGGWLSSDQAEALCDIADQFGSGVIDLTNRANLQVRGVAEQDHEAVLQALGAANLLDADARLEGRRNILVQPFWEADDLTARLASELAARLTELPELPAKFGFAVDTGAQPVLTAASADIRIEGTEDKLTVRADGADTAFGVEAATAIDAVIELADWFATTAQTKRMAGLLRDASLPTRFADRPALPSVVPLQPGQIGANLLAGVAFGQMLTATLRSAVREAVGVRTTPWRMILLEGIRQSPHADLITVADSPLMRADACAGAPYCASATVETRALARKLAGTAPGRLHVSGCAKGCARRADADITLIGRNGLFDMVRNGNAQTAPHRTGISPETLLTEFI
ncbi:cobalamin biosynthesis protein CobG [Pontivivens insulae]|uniref:Nitrite/Sulfite reductase ferredoxin-like domain-containing protein n=1 Tax=Pontivivens insulae TaxID=1639689 RepID=A0A2R8ACZ6_9RHOB|nr:cobalamin biosynthesis protein CobG [Pontivivens insulae]RED14043.1 precorrin-3B synthase [Pontivivens insulae]SPF30117.1 hypothetical protein POI8812_02448 [Pontivivens insulae]